MVQIYSETGETKQQKYGLFASPIYKFLIRNDELFSIIVVVTQRIQKTWQPSLILIVSLMKVSPYIICNECTCEYGNDTNTTTCSSSSSSFVGGCGGGVYFISVAIPPIHSSLNWALFSSCSFFVLHSLADGCLLPMGYFAVCIVVRWFVLCFGGCLLFIRFMVLVWTICCVWFIFEYPIAFLHSS